VFVRGARLAALRNAAAMLRLVSARCRAALSVRGQTASTGAAAAAAVAAASSVAVAGACYLATDDACESSRQSSATRFLEDALRVSRGSSVAACDAAGAEEAAGAAGASPFVAGDTVWCFTWRAPVHYVVDGVAGTATLCASYLLVATAACEAAAAGQGLTLVHFSAQLQRFLWARGCA